MSDHTPEADASYLFQIPGGFTPGSVIAGYRLEKLVGHGGMAVVYLARDERLRRRVALKVLAPAFAADADFRHRFAAESLAAAAVDDPHIIPVYDAGEAAGVLFIAMRYVSGGDVRSLLLAHGPMAAGRAAAIISPVASALDAAHDHGLVHRDVKPANMLIDVRPGRPDHVYLSDFGLSKGALSSAGLTRSGQFLGTPDYCAPEQIGGGQVTGRADQYSLACAVFEMLTAQTPFSRAHGLAVIYAHMSEPPPALTQLRPDLPAAADVVLARALAKAPHDRYPSCREFADDLRDALGLGSYAPLAATAEPVTSAGPAEFPAAGSAPRDPVEAPAASDSESGGPGFAATEVPAATAVADIGGAALPASAHGGNLVPPAPVRGSGERQTVVPAPHAASPSPGPIAAPDAGADVHLADSGGVTSSVRRRLGAMIPVTGALILVLLGGLFFGYRYIQSHYYIGTRNGAVVIFRGVNGLPFTSVSSQTGIPLAEVPTDFRTQIRSNSIAGNNAYIEGRLAIIRRGYLQCHTAYAKVRFWKTHRTRQVRRTVVTHGKPREVIVTVHLPRPPIPQSCPPLPG